MAGPLTWPATVPRTVAFILVRIRVEPTSCCGARQSLRPSKRSCALPTAATRSGRSSRPRRRSPRSPPGTRRSPQILLHTKKEHHPIRWCSFWHSLMHLHQGTKVIRASLYRLSVAKEVGSEGSAAGGRRRGVALCAAVGERRRRSRQGGHWAPQTFRRTVATNLESLPI